MAGGKHVRGQVLEKVNEMVIIAIRKSIIGRGSISLVGAILDSRSTGAFGGALFSNTVG